MKAIFQTSQFKRDFKRIKKRGKDLSKLKEVVSVIAKSEVLEERHRDHSLSGKWSGSRDCLTPSSVVLIGDREHDMLGARNNGVAGLGMLWGYGTRGELEAASAYVSTEAPSDLVVLLYKLLNNKARHPTP